MRWKFWRTTNDRRLTAFVQSHFLNVVRHGRLHESAERFARSGGLANRSGRNRLVNLAQQMDGYTLQHQISRGRLLMKRTCHFHARTQARWQRVSNISERKPGPAGNHKLALPKQRLCLVPLFDVSKGIDADQQKQPVRFLERLLKALDSVDGVVRFRQARLVFDWTLRSRIFRGFEQRWRKVLLFGCGESNHGVAVRKGQQRLALLVRLKVGWAEEESGKLTALARTARQRQVSLVHGVAGPANPSHIHPPLFS